MSLSIFKYLSAKKRMKERGPSKLRMVTNYSDLKSLHDSKKSVKRQRMASSIYKYLIPVTSFTPAEIRKRNHRRLNIYKPEPNLFDILHAYRKGIHENPRDFLKYRAASIKLVNRDGTLK